MRILLISISALLLVVPAAQAAAPAGVPVALLDVSSKHSALRADGVRIKATGTAAYRFKKLGFRISDVAISSARGGTFVLKDGFKLRKGRRSVSVRGMLVVVNGRKVRVTGKVSGKRRTIFTGRAPRDPVLDGGRISMSVSGVRLSLTKSATRLIRHRIRSFRPHRLRVGTFEAAAHVLAPPVSGVPTIDPVSAHKCNPLTPGAATDLPRPASAVDLTCGYFIWALRSSWIDYLEFNSPVEPALALPPIEGKDHYCPVERADNPDSYYFYLPVTAGWWDAASGTGDLRLAGGIRFQYAAHGLDITVKDLDVRFNGASSEIWLTAFDADTPGGERIKFATFDARVPTAGGPLAPGTAATRFGSAFTTAANDLLLKYYGVGGDAGCFDLGVNF